MKHCTLMRLNPSKFYQLEFVPNLLDSINYASLYFIWWDLYIRISCYKFKAIWFSVCNSAYRPWKWFLKINATTYISSRCYSVRHTSSFLFLHRCSINTHFSSTRFQTVAAYNTAAFLSQTAPFAPAAIRCWSSIRLLFVSLPHASTPPLILTLFVFALIFILISPMQISCLITRLPYLGGTNKKYSNNIKIQSNHTNRQ